MPRPGLRPAAQFLKALSQKKISNASKGLSINCCILSKQKNIMDGKIINIDPEILCGTPVFFGTRVP
ncbi:MAG: DUF433 domain-containing protein, partial [Ferruginibacter sp.]|nr:DUF433 domain-containing protein [Ferruginibacter sp.]